jgi:hypothetical protein
MEPGIIMTLIICGTILAVAMIGILFAMWVITKGLQVARENKK